MLQQNLKMCAFKSSPPPCFSREVPAAPLLLWANCSLLSLLNLNLFGSRGFVAADLSLGDGPHLEALPFGGARGVPQYCQVPLRCGTSDKAVTKLLLLEEFGSHQPRLE